MLVSTGPVYVPVEVISDSVVFSQLVMFEKFSEVLLSTDSFDYGTQSERH